MRIIKIEAYDNGGHDNNGANFDYEIIPEGWAVVPDDMETPNFPFGDIEVKEIGGVMTVTKWTERDIPEPPEKPVSELEQLRADIDYIAIMAGVDL